MTWVDDGIRKNDSKRKYRKMTMAIKQIVILVMYDEKVGKAPLQKAVKAYKCEVIYDYNIINGMALKKPEDKSLEETMQHFRGVKGVVAVEYDHITRLTDPVKPRLETR